MNQEEFIAKAKRIHGDKYDYSLVEYKKLKAKVTLICPNEHIIQQRPDNHLLGFGCKECPSRYSGFNQEIFLQRMNGIFHDELIFNKSVYINNSTPVIIECPKHGEFTKTPWRLFLGRGCLRCLTEFKMEKGITIQMTESEFLAKIPAFIKDQFKIDFKNYRGYNKPITVICSVHGEIRLNAAQSLFNQRKTNPCDQCFLEESRARFINNSLQIHGNRYNYSRVIYESSMSKVIITCPTHGDFLITPNCHLNCKGCSRCSFSKGETFITNFLKKHNIMFESQKRFPDCKLKAKLRFDFYLPLENICIEFDGYWHFHPYRGDNNQFDLIKRRDRIKNIYCRENHIPLIRISGLKNIEPVLTKLLLN